MITVKDDVNELTISKQHPFSYNETQNVCSPTEEDDSLMNYKYSNNPANSLFWEMES